jgi:hypothetical protein
MTTENVILPEEVLIRNDYRTFKFLKHPVNLYSEELSFGRNTVAELNGQFYYLGDEPSSLASAIFAWQEVHNRVLTVDELKEILRDNIHNIQI